MSEEPERLAGERAARTLARLDTIEEIPSLPPVLLRIWDLADREETSAEDLGRAMNEDPGLTGTVLRLANSAYFGFPQRIGTVTQAIVVLGFDTVKSLAMGASVVRGLSPGGSSKLDAHRFFRHGLASAMGAQAIAQGRFPQKRGAAFTGGVLHDLGKLVIAEFLSTEVAKVLERIASGADLLQAEREILGLTHAGVGAWFAARWNLPEEIIAAIEWHHEPAHSGEYVAFVSAVHLGNVVAHRADAAFEGQLKQVEAAPEAIAALDLEEGVLEELVNRVKAGVQEGTEALSASGR